MKGWKCKIGLLVPAINIVAEPTCYQYAPKHVTIHAERLPREERNSTIEVHMKMLQHVVGAAQTLAQCEPDVLILADTTASFLQGKGGDLKIAREMEESTGIRSSTASTAVIEALNALSVNKVSIITPYPSYTNEREVVFFNEYGFKVDQLQSMEILDSLNMGKVYPDDIYRFARDNYDRESDAIFISCTNFRGTEVIKDLEEDTGLPVVTSNQACLWWALRSVGMGVDIGLGKLFQK